MKKNLTIIARDLRKNSTEAERALWYRLSRRQLEGYKFRRQQPIGRYVVDFVSFERKLVIEVDGGQHKVQKEEDKKRDNWLERNGFKVLRFWNSEMFENLEGVLNVVRRNLLPPPPAPPARGGEM